MKAWHVTVESLLMLLLWLANALSDIIICIYLFLFHDHGGLVMVIVLGTGHFLLNGWILRFRFKSMNTCGLAVLFITQTAPFNMLCRRAWQSMVPYCAKDSRTKKRKILIAKNSLFCHWWSSNQKFPVESDSLQKGSCIPAELVPVSNHVSTTIPDSDSGGENEDPMLDHLFTVDEHNAQQVIPLGSTKFTGDTYDIELNFNEPEQLYIGEPNFIKFVLKVLQVLYMDEKKLSYHIVTDKQNKILYVTKSDRHIRNLPSRNIPGTPLTVCNDIHYAFNLTRGLGYEVYAITKRTFEESNFFVEADLSKIIWSLVWPSAVIKFYAILNILESRKETSHAYFLLSPLLSIVTWLLTQKGISESWRNAAILIPLRITMTVPRSLLVISIAQTGIFKAVICYASVKMAGILSLIAHLTYYKKYKNIELYSNDIEKYIYNPILEPVIQIFESAIYLIWAIWWYSVTPRSSFAMATNIHFPLIFLLTTLLGHVFGVTWLFFARSLLRNPFKNPQLILKKIHSLEYIKT